MRNREFIFEIQPTMLQLNHQIIYSICCCYCIILKQNGNNLCFICNPDPKIRFKYTEIVKSKKQNYKKMILMVAVVIGLMLSGNAMSQDVKKTKEEAKTEVKDAKVGTKADKKGNK